MLDETAWRKEAMYLIGYSVGVLSAVSCEVNENIKERIQHAIKTIQERSETLK